VNIGIFLCMRCGSIHRGVGTHISIPKGCTGTYLWGPDEIERMKLRGNQYCAETYGGEMHRPSQSASDEEWRRFIIDKYEHRRFCGDTNYTKTRNEIEKEMDLITFAEDRNTVSASRTVAKKEETDFFSQFGV